MGVSPLMWIVPATMSQPLQPEFQLPWMSTTGTFAAGVEAVSTLPSVVSTKRIPLAGGEVQVWFPR